MKLSRRHTIIYDLPLPEGTIILRPEFVVVRFPNGKTADIGALCYISRKPAPKLYQADRKGRQVVLSSFSQERAERVRALISHISADLNNSGRRVETVREMTTRFVAFMSWVDENGFHGLLNSHEEARPAIQAYAHHIRERVVANAISINSGARQQSTVFSLLGEFLEVDNLTRGISLLRVNTAAQENTTPPNESAQAKVLALSESLFDGVATLVLDKKTYPYALNMPKYLNFQNNILWIFPALSWFRTPKNLTSYASKSCIGYNYSEGRINTIQEIKALKGYVGENINAQLIVGYATKNIQQANSNFRHSQRLHVSMMASNAFIILFLAQTGMNWAQVVNLTWANDYDISSEHQSFRTIKWRAGGKECFFELPIAFMRTFKRYLDLREYLLDGRHSDWLFFKLGPRGMGDPVQIKSGLTGTYGTMRRIDPDLPEVHPRQWRAAKSDWLIRNTDPATTAIVLQNSEKTVLASYTKGSEASHLEEISEFLDKVSEVVVDKEMELEGAVSRAVGSCTSFGSPHQKSGFVSVQSDCKGVEGCLFCDKFKVHADEVDTRKLLSCRYCLQQTAPLVGSEERYQLLIDPILKRIEAILSEISIRDKTLLLKVTKEVDEDGELDPYWARKLEMLMELGVVL